jgi:hypothetical protein
MVSLLLFGLGAMVGIVVWYVPALVLSFLAQEVKIRDLEKAISKINQH